MSASIRATTARAFLIAVFIQVVAAGCDMTSPVSTKDGLNAPTDPSLSVSPSSISATVVSWSEIDLRWATSPSVTSYQIFRSTTGPGGAYNQIAGIPSNVSTYANTGLNGATQYCYEIRSVKVSGKNTTYGAFSNAVCATTLPPPVVAPSETDASPYGVSIRIRWKDNSADENGFSIEQASSAVGPWTQVSSVGANVTTTFVSYVPLEQIACFRVTAFNTVGPSLPSTPDCTAIPAVPYLLSATPLNQQGITLTWSDNSQVEDGYRVARQQEGGAWTDIATVGANVTTYFDAGAAPNISYTYHVTPLKDGGFSIPSNELVAVIATIAPNAPTNAGAFYYFDYWSGFIYLDVYWNDASSNESGFHVEYSVDGRTGWTPLDDAVQNSTYLEEQYYDFNPPPGGCYRVIAFNSVGPSSPSNTTCSEPFGSAGDLVATAVDAQSIDLTWTDLANYETGFEILRSTSFDGGYSFIAVAPANATSYHDTGLASGQEYWYLLVPLYDSGPGSSYSNYASATTPSGSSIGGAAPRSNALVRPAPKHPIRIIGGPQRATRRVKR